MNHRPPQSRPQPCTRRGGFTLIELLVVLGIIAILMTLSITVGRAVTRGGEDRITRDHIRILDTTLTAWFAEKESKFPGYLVSDGDVGTNTNETHYPIVDGRDEMMSSPGQTEPTLAAYLLIASESAAVNQTIRQQIDEKYLANATLRWTSNSQVATYNGQQSALTVLDAWRQPIRFVHPLWHGGYGRCATAPARPPRVVTPKGYAAPVNYVRSFRQVSGGVGDADEGLCPSNRPYFYSSGRDGNPGTRDDNIYTTVPSFPPETAEQN